MRSIMSASLVERIPVDEQLQSLMAVVQQLRQEVGELRRENAELRRQVSELQCDVGYWKSLHARAVERNSKLQAELDQSKAEIRQLKSERFGKQWGNHPIQNSPIVCNIVGGVRMPSCGGR